MRRRPAWRQTMTLLLLFRATRSLQVRSVGLQREATRLAATSSRELRFLSGRTNGGYYGPADNLLGNAALLGNAVFSTSASAVATMEPVFTVSGGGPRDNLMQNGSTYNGHETPHHSSQPRPCEGYGPTIQLTPEEKELFDLLRQVRKETHLSTTLRVAGGWVRDKLLATAEFQPTRLGRVRKQQRLTSKFKPSAGRQGTKVISNENDCLPVDIDIALDDMLGREYADHLNHHLSGTGHETASVGVVLKNPEKSKHLETATMKVGTFWIDFVNLRAEEYTQDSRIPDLMRIGTPAEDAFRRDLTINALFFNINTGQVEDWTGRGFDDLKRGIVATPLAPLTTLLDDPLRALRSVRFAARLRFTMDPDLVEAAKDDRVRTALDQKVSRERVGCEVDLMLRSPDPVGAMRLLINLDMVDIVFPIAKFQRDRPQEELASVFDRGLELLSTTHDHLCDCKDQPPIWCESKLSHTTHGFEEKILMQDEEARRLLWYAAFLKPFSDDQRVRNQKTSRRQGKKANRSVVCKLLVDELKRPIRDADATERIMKAADEITQLINSGCDLSAASILLSDIRVMYSKAQSDRKEHISCFMNGHRVDSGVEDDPVWQHAMEFRLLCSKMLNRVNGLWRAALILSLSEQLTELNDGLEYTIEGDVVDESHAEYYEGVIAKYDAFATALQRIGLIGIWSEKPILDGGAVKQILPRIPKGPSFRDVMDAQEDWMISHPGADQELLVSHLQETFPDFV